MGVSNDPRELLLKNMIQKADNLFFLKLSHFPFPFGDRASTRLVNLLRSILFPYRAASLTELSGYEQNLADVSARLHQTMCLGGLGQRELPVSKGRNLLAAQRGHTF